MTKEELDLQVRLMAIENLLTMLFVENCIRHGFSEATVRSRNEKLIEKARQETFPGIDPALIDHVADQYQQHVSRLLRDVEEKMAKLTFR